MQVVLLALFAITMILDLLKVCTKTRFTFALPEIVSKLFLNRVEDHVEPELLEVLQLLIPADCL